MKLLKYWPSLVDVLNEVNQKQVISGEPLLEKQNEMPNHEHPISEWN